jgi:cytochrome P450/NADPH-cytochrome P450 reductase
LDLLDCYSSIDLPFATYVDQLAELQPRYYSIASSHLTSAGSVDIAVSRVAGAALGGNGNYLGACSSTLSDTEVGESIWARIRSVDSEFLPPQDLQQPIIMIGPGTGVAPFRGFIQDRMLHLKQGKTLGEAILFFGCRHPDVDEIYGDEFAEAQAAGAVSCIKAYSRAPAHPHRYVQDAIAANANRIWELWTRGARIYVCGDAQYMLPGVRHALQHIYQDAYKKEGETISDKQAQVWLQEMEVAGRFLVDAWA